jgi:hypothetical protein
MNAEVERDWPCCLCPDGLTPGRELKRLLQWTNGFNGQHVFLDLEIEVSTTGIVMQTSRLETSPEGDSSQIVSFTGSARAKARAGGEKSYFEARARGQAAVHGHVKFLLCSYPRVDQSDTSDRPEEELSAASASESTPSGISWSLRVVAPPTPACGNALFDCSGWVDVTVRLAVGGSWGEGWRGPRSWAVLEGAAATGGTSFFLESSSEVELSSSTKICTFEPALARSSSSELELARLVCITRLAGHTLIPSVSGWKYLPIPSYLRYSSLDTPRGLVIDIKTSQNPHYPN